MKTQFVVKKILSNGGSKIVVVPKKSDFEVGEYVKISKLEDDSQN